MFAPRGLSNRHVLSYLISPKLTLGPWSRLCAEPFRGEDIIYTVRGSHHVREHAWIPDSPLSFSSVSGYTVLDLVSIGHSTFAPGLCHVFMAAIGANKDLRAVQIVHPSPI